MHKLAVNGEGHLQGLRLGTGLHRRHDHLPLLHAGCDGDLLLNTGEAECDLGITLRLVAPVVHGRAPEGDRYVGLEHGIVAELRADQRHLPVLIQLADCGRVNLHALDLDRGIRPGLQLGIQGFAGNELVVKVDERRQWQHRLVVDVRQGTDAVAGVGRTARLLHARRGQLQLLAGDLHLRPMPDAILVGQIEERHLLFAVGDDRAVHRTSRNRLSDQQSALGKIKFHNKLIALDLVALEHRPVCHDLLSILVLERMQGKALAGQCLVTVMNSAGDVDLRGHARIENVARQPEAEPHFALVIERQSVIRTRCVELMEIDREVALSPDLAPAADQCVQPVVVVHTFEHARIALVPDRAAKGIRNNRIHPAVKHPGGITVALHIAGRLGGDRHRRLALFHQLGIPCDRRFNVLVELLPRGLVLGCRRIGLEERLVDRLGSLILAVLEAALRGPGPNAGHAEGAVQNADRNTQLLVNLVCERCRNGTEVPHVAVLPGACRVLDRVERGIDAADLELADDGLLLFAGRNRLSDTLQKHCHIACAGLPLHVRLAGGHPDLADEHIFKDDLLAVAAGDGHLGRLGVRLQRLQLERPLTVLTGFGADLLACELDRDLRAGLAPAPDREIHLPLQDHVIAEGRAQLDREHGLRHCGACRFVLLRDTPQRRKQQNSHGFQNQTSSLENLCHFYPLDR